MRNPTLDKSSKIPALTAVALHKLYTKAEQADERFQGALKAEYGSDACNKRYCLSHKSEHVTRCRDEFQAAMEAWRTAYRAFTQTGTTGEPRRAARRGTPWLSITRAIT